MWSQAPLFIPPGHRERLGEQDCEQIPHSKTQWRLFEEWSSCARTQCFWMCWLDLLTRPTFIAQCMWRRVQLSCGWVWLRMLTTLRGQDAVEFGFYGTRSDPWCTFPEAKWGWQMGWGPHPQQSRQPYKFLNTQLDFFLVPAHPSVCLFCNL